METATQPTISDTLRAHIEARSINSLSKQANVTRASISRFRRGSHGLNLETAEKLCQALNLRLLRDPGRPACPALPQSSLPSITR